MTVSSFFVVLPIVSVISNLVELPGALGVVEGCSLINVPLDSMVVILPLDEPIELPSVVVESNEVIFPLDETIELASVVDCELSEVLLIIVSFFSVVPFVITIEL